MFGSHLFASTLFAYVPSVLRKWQAICKKASDWDDQSESSDSWSSEAEASSSWAAMSKSSESWSDEAEASSDWAGQGKDTLQSDDC